MSIFDTIIENKKPKSVFDDIVENKTKSVFDDIVGNKPKSLFDGIVENKDADTKSADWDDRVARTLTLSEELVEIRSSVKK